MWLLYLFPSHLISWSGCSLCCPGLGPVAHREPQLHCRGSRGGGDITEEEDGRSCRWITFTGLCCNSELCMCIVAGLSSHSLSCIFSWRLELDNVKCWETWPEFVQSCSSVHYQLCCTPRCSTAGGQHVRCSIYTLLEFVRSNEEQFTTQ